MNLIILASSGPDPYSLGEFLKILSWCVGGLATVIGLLLALWKTVFNPPFARKSEVDVLRGDFDKRQTAATASRKQIHEKVEKLDTRLGRVEQQNIAQDDHLKLLNSEFREFAKEQRAVNHEILKRLPK